MKKLSVFGSATLILIVGSCVPPPVNEAQLSAELETKKSKGAERKRKERLREEWEREAQEEEKAKAEDMKLLQECYKEAWKHGYFDRNPLAESLPSGLREYKPYGLPAKVYDFEDLPLEYFKAACKKARVDCIKACDRVL